MLMKPTGLHIISITDQCFITSNLLSNNLVSDLDTNDLYLDCEGVISLVLCSSAVTGADAGDAAGVWFNCAQ